MRSISKVEVKPGTELKLDVVQLPAKETPSRKPNVAMEFLLWHIINSYNYVKPGFQYHSLALLSPDNCFARQRDWQQQKENPLFPTVPYLRAIERCLLGDL